MKCDFKIGDKVIPTYSYNLLKKCKNDLYIRSIEYDEFYDYYSKSKTGVYYLTFENVINKGYYNRFNMKNFKIDKVKEEVTVTNLIDKLVVNSKGSLIQVMNNENLDEIVSNLLRNNPGSSYRIYSYEKTAKLPPLSINWVVEENTVENETSESV
jgi:hypothetical protein